MQTASNITMGIYNVKEMTQKPGDFHERMLVAATISPYLSTDVRRKLRDAFLRQKKLSFNDISELSSSDELRLFSSVSEFFNATDDNFSWNNTSQAVRASVYSIWSDLEMESASSNIGITATEDVWFTVEEATTPEFNSLTKLRYTLIKRVEDILPGSGFTLDGYKHLHRYM